MDIYPKELEVTVHYIIFKA